MIDGAKLLEFAAQMRLFGKRMPRASKPLLLRRTVSTSYYALFHFLVDMAARELTGGDRLSAAYRLAYRTYSHGEMQKACKQISGRLNKEHAEILGIEQFCPEIQRCASTFAELKQQRESADYDPAAKFTVAEIRANLEKARYAMESLDAAPADERKLFLMLLRFKIRS